MQQDYTQPARNDKFVLYILLFVGVLGLAFVQFSSPKKSNSDQSLYVVNNGKVQEATVRHSAAPNSELDSRLITTNLQPEAHRPFTFKMEGFSSGAEYMLDLGDGNTRTFVRGELTYTYPRKGTFVIKLISKNELGVRMLQQNEVKVAPAPEYDELTEYMDYSAK